MQGFGVFKDQRNRKLLVVPALGRIFMGKPYSDPFMEVSRILERYPLGTAVHAILVDFHAEATSEKMAMGHHCDGRASLVAGTHTHVPTADCKIMKGGTAYISDVGMCGCYDSVIGMKHEEPLSRFVTGINRSRLEPSSGPAAVCGVLVEVDDATGKAIRADPLRAGEGISLSTPGE